MRRIYWALITVAGIVAFMPCHAQDIDELKNNTSTYQDEIHESILESMPKIKPSPFAPFTGLIIDARGIPIKPCLRFQVSGNLDGRLFGQSKPVPDLLREKGMCGWAVSTEEALNYQRAGLNPIKLKATGINHANPVCIFIDDSKLDQNLSAKIKLFFKKNAVVVIF